MVAAVDDSDYEYLNQFKWYARKCKKTFYAERSIKVNGKFTNQSMHTLIMNTPEGMEVDHVDHIGLNCQRLNMRICTHSQNCMNRINRGLTKYKGVCYNGSRVRCVIYLRKKQIHLGYFKTEIEAAKAYDSKAKELFGEYANLNFKEL